MSNPTFSILITTKNRIHDLQFTLVQIQHLLERDDVECIICDDGSSDGTSHFIVTNYKTIQLIKNVKSKGLIFSRNRLLHLTRAKYAITLDDDAHIVSPHPLESIADFFVLNKKCAVIAFRIFWGKTLPSNVNHDLINQRVKGFVGCGHVWRMDAWRDIPNYPDWFVFYGEEDYAGFHLFKKDWEIWFVPDVLVHHRVEVKVRKGHKDYMIRLRRSLRSGWYLFFMFYPIQIIPKKMFYSIWIQLKLKVFKGDFKALLAICFALSDLVWAMPRIIKKSNRLTNRGYNMYENLPQTKIYWKQ